jgi:D-xylose transport system substrate-binding protein
MFKKKYISLGIVLITITSFISFNCGKKNNSPTGKKGLKIAFLMETYSLDRWKRDETNFREEADSLGAEVLRAVADGDQNRQNNQADNFLTEGVNGLVVVPKNLNTAAAIIEDAHQNHVPVIAYDRLIMNCDLDLYITFDNKRVGYLQAEGILKKVPQGNYILLGGASSDNNAKLIREGQLEAIKDYETKTGKKINILADPYLDNWDRDEARRKISNLLTKFKAEGKKVDAIVASNDATAGGVVAALMAENLESKVAVSGQDAELTACQRIVEGTQTVTVYKPIKQLARTAAAAIIQLAKGQKPEEVIKSLGYKVNYINNGYKEVPSIFLTPVYVDKDNIVQTVIKDGWQPLDKVFANIPKDKWPKQPQ